MNKDLVNLIATQVSALRVALTNEIGRLMDLPAGASKEEIGALSDARRALVLAEGYLPR